MTENKQTDWLAEDYDLCALFQKIIKRCPFCGQKAEIFLGPFSKKAPYVQCIGDDDKDDNCRATIIGNSLTDAAIKWSRRVTI